jgi:hypothetical protein
VDLRRRSLGLLNVLALAGIIAATGSGCRSSSVPPPAIQRELGAARAATVPGDAEGVVERGLVLSGPELRATWQYRHARDATPVHSDAERQLVGEGYRCNREERTLSCGKSLPGDRVNIVMSASDVDDTTAAWNVEFTVRAD